MHELRTSQLVCISSNMLQWEDVTHQNYINLRKIENFISQRQVHEQMVTPESIFTSQLKWLKQREKIRPYLDFVLVRTKKVSKREKHYKNIPASFGCSIYRSVQANLWASYKRLKWGIFNKVLEHRLSSNQTVYKILV